MGGDGEVYCGGDGVVGGVLGVDEGNEDLVL